MRPLNHEQAEKLRPLRKQLTAIVDEVAKIESVMLGLCDHTSTLGNCPACQLEHNLQGTAGRIHDVAKEVDFYLERGIHPREANK